MARNIAGTQEYVRECFFFLNKYGQNFANVNIICRNDNNLHKYT